MNFCQSIPPPPFTQETTEEEEEEEQDEESFFEDEEFDEDEEMSSSFEHVIERRVVEDQVQYKVHLRCNNWGLAGGRGGGDGQTTQMMWEQRRSLGESVEKYVKHFDKKYVADGLSLISQISQEEESIEYHVARSRDSILPAGIARICSDDSSTSTEQDCSDMMDVISDDESKEPLQVFNKQDFLSSSSRLLRSLSRSLTIGGSFPSNNSSSNSNSQNSVDNKTGLFYDIRCAFHSGAPDEPESPLRYRACIEGLHSLDISNRCVLIPSVMASHEDVLTIHDKQLVETLKRSCDAYYPAKGYKTLDNSLYVNPYTYHAALLSAGAGIEITKRVFSGSLKNGMCLTRPPGHHCTRKQQSGFCHINNIAIATEYLRRNCQNDKGNAPRVAIVDWDVHHGNGTEEIFRNNNEVLFISTHQKYSDDEDDGDDLFFPGTGEHSFVGDRDARGKTVNLPLPIGCGDAEFRSLFDEIVLPIVQEFQPDIVLVSAGFDAAEGDPLGSLEITPKMFGYMTSQLMQFQKLVLFLEGGYNPIVVSQCVVKCTQALLGEQIQYCPPPSENIPFLSVLSKFIRTHRTYWKNIKLPENCEKIKITKVVRSIRKSGKKQKNAARSNQ